MARDEIKRLLRSRKKYFTECQSRYAVITKDDEERIYKFACSVVPRTWNMWTGSYGKPNTVRGILNIWLGVFKSQENIDIMGEAERFGITYHYGIAHTHIIIYPDKGDWPWTVIQELAHIATYRRVSIINKPYKKEFGNTNPEMHGEEMHGPRFHRALHFFESRMLDRYNYQYVLEYALLHRMSGSI